MDKKVYVKCVIEVIIMCRKGQIKELIYDICIFRKELDIDKLTSYICKGCLH